MNQVVKHPAGDSTRLENKRERRRGAAGRAAALRRAPSDSDCSGETASLSADSGDRAPRPPPPPPRSGKSRSRRRGSEWEVLEGLKDGQRFDKRPDVFNGYLHKKRKWPLKGWHKRFFVVDGGILVYARSPSDVARGRLHGSVDVGLSVISAKARRRRIDIDADEFIYHLRAKTPELFRTWLNVLKAHRLYRQHLLTFGARESVPKIHPPLEDLPATDTSSRTSLSSSYRSETSTADNPDPITSVIDGLSTQVKSSVYNHKDKSSIFRWQRKASPKTNLIPPNMHSRDEKIFDLKIDDNLRNRSLCSMNCMATRFMQEIKMMKSPNLSLNSTDAEKQMISTDLGLNSLKKHIINTAENSENFVDGDTNQGIKYDFNKHHFNLPEIERKPSPFLNLSKMPTSPTACFFFHRKKKVQVDNTDSVMKRSKKCTNLVRYRNMSNEPPLKKQPSKCMLLTRYQLKVSKDCITDNFGTNAMSYDIVHKKHHQLQDEDRSNENKATQYTTSAIDVDNITEKLITSLFFKNIDNRDKLFKHTIEQVVKELYDVNVDPDQRPLKVLFKSLLEYWLKNTSATQFKKVMTCEKGVQKKARNKIIMKDKNISNVFIGVVSRETQFNGFIDLIGEYKINRRTNITRRREKSVTSDLKCPLTYHQAPKHDDENYEKEKRIQELEKLLKNTVYLCETGRDARNKEKDIRITKKLIDNLGKASNNDVMEPVDEKPILIKSSSSAELPKIQDTINHLISETSIPPDVAKEFFGAYLDMLLQNSSKSTTTSQSSEWSPSKDIPVCDVAAESIVTKVSKSVTTSKAVENSQNKYKINTSVTEKLIDPGQVYLKDILDKVTTIFSKVTNIENNTWRQIKTEESPNSQLSNAENSVKDKLGKPVIKCSNKDIIYENYDNNSLVIDLSKYKLEQVSMYSDPSTKGTMSITIKLKEKPPTLTQSKQTRLSLKFSNSKHVINEPKNSEDWLACLHSDDSGSNDIFKKFKCASKTRFFNFDTNENMINLERCSSVSDATPKAPREYRVLNEINKTIDQQTPATILNDTNKKISDDPQSIYIMSITKKMLTSKLQTKKILRLKERTERDGILLKSAETPNRSVEESLPSKIEDLSLFEKPAPRVIDEKFILLLLENLTLLSKSVPTLYKDINTIYIKLKKKHEKILKNCSNIQGLSLLGKIYSEDPSFKEGVDKATQYELSIKSTNINQKYTNDNGTNTVLDKLGNRSTDAFPIKNKQWDFETQTEERNTVEIRLSLGDILKCSDGIQTSPSLNHTKPLKSDIDRMIVTQTETIDIASANEATSNNNPLTMTKERAVDTMIQYVLNRTSSRNCRVTPARPIHIEKDWTRKRLKQTCKAKLSLSLCHKVSTPSQTEKRNTHTGNKYPDQDFNVYQLFLSNKYEVKKSSSVAICAKVNQNLSDDLKTLYRCSSEPSCCSGLISPSTPHIRGPQAGFVSGTPGGRLAGWIIESGGPLENTSRELGQAQLSVQQLQRLLDALDHQQQLHHDTDVSLEGASPNVKKDRRKFGLRKKKSNSKCASVELAPPHIDPSTSHSALSALTAPPSPGGGASSIPNSAASLPIACAAARPQSLPGAESLVTVPGPASLTSLTPDHQLREDFTVLAKDLVASLKGVVSTLVCERGRLRAALEAAESTATPGGAVMSALRTNLTSALQQNSELRTRLSRIHDASDIAEICSVNNSDAVNHKFQQSLSYSSSCVSASEFFDAEEHEDDDLKPDEVIAADETGVIELDGDSSSEAGSLSSEEGSASSDNSDGAMVSAEQATLRLSECGRGWARRTRLPAPRPSAGGPSLWNLLYKNIGKDLSQISMPVTINEPLNMLQRLCEELEYSELLDAAALCAGAAERMSLVAAFAVSAYASAAHRAASKPFNPLLGETYECVRDDRGFRFLAEQVSHHPPISACHAESPRWCFWQEARIKTKFWGKSMEFQPTGRVHVRLHSTGDHYVWNKVTTCVHNLFGGQRWVDQYGDMHITCVGSDISCKLNFIKASSWSQSRHEVRGVVAGGGSGGVRLRLAGRWSEALLCGDPPAARALWRPGAMPPDHELYYGFTRFAMELNEMEPGMREILPHTDTRFRPDQRALEEGDVEAAEQFKHELEQAQRERRRENPQHTPAWFRKTVEDGEETWVFSGEYWKAREAGFSPDVAPRIW